MYIDYKISVWQRLYFNDEADIKILVDKLEEGYRPMELCEDEFGFDHFEQDLETECFITPEENDGFSTIELYNDDFKLVWDNTKKDNDDNRRS